jgi:hypothetical protein
MATGLEDAWRRRAKLLVALALDEEFSMDELLVLPDVERSTMQWAVKELRLVGPRRRSGCIDGARATHAAYDTRVVSQL